MSKSPDDTELTESRLREQYLSDARSQLERRVHERTAELEVANTILGKEIEERKRAQENLANLLREKEIYLKEIHHRVKNNLQLIISILNLHTDSIQDSLAQRSIIEIRDRIYAIAQLHETLYQSGDFGLVDLSEYLRQLVAHLLRSGEETRSIEVDYDLESIKLSIDDTLPCGLIVNELVMNSIKHAFLEQPHPRLTIRLRHVQEGAILLHVGDNGVGMPEDRITNRTNSIGLHLVRQLSKKLGAKLEYRRSDGAQFDILFTPSPE